MTKAKETAVFTAVSLLIKILIQYTLFYLRCQRDSTKTS